MVCEFNNKFVKHIRLTKGNMKVEMTETLYTLHISKNTQKQCEQLSPKNITNRPSII